MDKRPPAGFSSPITQSDAGSDAASAPASRFMLSRSLADTEHLGHRMGAALQGGEVLGLYGDVGTGKTALVRGIAAGLGAASRHVSSPTFVLIHEYQGRLPLAHADLYRLESPDTLPYLGLEEYFDGRTVVAVEWAERAGRELPSDRIDVRFGHHSQTERTIAIAATGEYSQRALARMFHEAQGSHTATPPGGVESPLTGDTSR